jgi:hypothetical protein
MLLPIPDTADKCSVIDLKLPPLQQQSYGKEQWNLRHVCARNILLFLVHQLLSSVSANMV